MYNTSYDADNVRIAYVADERRETAGCDVTMSDDDVTRLESCLDDVGRSLVVDYTKSQRRRRKDKFHVCRSAFHEYNQF